MVKINLVVCDVCKDPQRETEPYTVTGKGRRRSMDLCEEHSAPLGELLAATEEPSPPRKRAPARLQRRVTTMEEIAARKGASS